MPTLALSMIVRNAEADLERCLASVQGIVDEIVIADTGSTDATGAIARSFGVKLFSIPWTNDFAEARNRSLEQVTSDWVLVLDADEQLDMQQKDLVRGAISQKNVAGYLVNIRNYVNSLEERIWDRTAVANRRPPQFAANYPAYIDHQNVRLFRKSPEIFFTGRVHETVGHQIESSKGVLREASFLIHHHGLAASQETKAKKNEFYRELGRAKVSDQPENAQAHFELGVLEFDSFHNYEEALGLFQKATSLKPKFGEAWMFAGLSFAKLERWQEALQCYETADRMGHAPALSAEFKGDAGFALRDFAGAISHYRRALKHQTKKTDLESKLAMCDLQTGNVSAALSKLEQCVNKEPGKPELHDRWIAALVASGDWVRAAAAAEDKIEKVTPDDRCYFRAASIHAQLNQWDKVRDLLQRGLAAFPGASCLQQALREIEPAAELAAHDVNRF